MITSYIEINRIEGDHIKIRFIFVNLLGEESQYNANVPLDTDVDALLLEIEAQYDQQDIDNEVQQHWDEMEQGGNPYYEFVDPVWQRKVFTFTTFENSFNINMKRAMGPEFSHSKSEGIRIIKPSWDASILSPDNPSSLLSMSVPQQNKVSSDTANITSIDTIEADMWGQHFDAFGNPIL